MKFDWSGKRVVIIGAARQGQAAARWLVRHGAIVTINDRRPFEQLADACSALQDLPLTWVTGRHPLDILDAVDIVCLSGGVPLNNPIVVEALGRGIPLTNDTQIFMEAVACRTVGITGSAGKTTTTTLLGQMAKLALGDRVRVGGNIGDPLLNYVDEMKPDHLAILEISSFQLEQMTISPNVALVLNITPNHLDRHGTMEEYTAAKQRILDHQISSDIAILCREDAGSWQLQHRVHGTLISFGLDRIQGKEDGTFLSDGILHLREHGVEIPLLSQEKILLRGRHNVLNVLAAFAGGLAIGLPLEAMLEAAAAFRGVPHRLEFVREWHGACWYNDSIATTPERAIAAVQSFDEPIVLLLGGRDKNLPWEDLAALIRKRVENVVLFGEAAEKIASSLVQTKPDSRKKPGSGFPRRVEKCVGLEEAVQAASRLATPGSIVLLSPGGTSFDQFVDFEARGKAFRQWVSELS